MSKAKMLSASGASPPDPDSGAVLGKNIWGPGPSLFGRQQWLSKITI